MNWHKGFSSRYYCAVVDTDSWRDTERQELKGGSIYRTDSGLMESGDIDLTEIPGEGEIWIRVWLDARQADDGAHEPLFTGLMSAPMVEWDGVRRTYRTECYSVLKPAEDLLLARGWYVPAGTDGAMAAAELLNVGPAPVSYEENAPTLASSIVAEEGETNLSMAWRIVNAIGWRIRINGRGEISIEPKASEPAATLDALENDCMELVVQDTRDWFKCPNVFRATFNELMAVARDDDEDSPLSTVNRGREVWMEEIDCTLNSGESIEDYALRRLREEQSPARTVKYNRRFIPDTVPGDLLLIHYPVQGLEGNFCISEQRIDLGYGAGTQEEVIGA